jgi:hypothetical protein
MVAEYYSLVMLLLSNKSAEYKYFKFRISNREANDYLLLTYWLAMCQLLWLFIIYDKLNVQDNHWRTCVPVQLYLPWSQHVFNNNSAMVYEESSHFLLTSLHAYHVGT